MIWISRLLIVIFNIYTTCVGQAPANAHDAEVTPLNAALYQFMLRKSSFVLTVHV